MLGFEQWLSSTMIIERIVGIGTYLLLLFIAYNEIKKVKKIKQLNRILNVYLVFLFLLGFFFIPDPSKDLYRWLNLSQNWEMLSVKDFFEKVAMQSGTPVSYFYIYLCRKSGIDGLLPGMCSLVFHYNVFKILKITYKSEEYTGREIATSLLFFMCMGRMLEAISGVRSMVAISILASCYVSELIGGKIEIKNIFFGIIAALIHPLALALFIMRYVFVVFQKSSKLIFRLFSLVVSTVLLYVLYRYGQLYLTGMFTKAESYLSGGHYVYTWEYIIAGIMWVICFFIIKKAYAIKRTEGIGNLHDLLLFTTYLLIISAVLVIQYSMFHRLVTFNSMMILPVVAYVVKNCGYSRYYFRLKYALWAVMLLAAARGDLCGYMFFNL